MSHIIDVRIPDKFKHKSRPSLDIIKKENLAPFRSRNGPMVGTGEQISKVIKFGIYRLATRTETLAMKNLVCIRPLLGLCFVSCARDKPPRPPPVCRTIKFKTVISKFKQMYSIAIYVTFSCYVASDNFSGIYSLRNSRSVVGKKR